MRSMKKLLFVPLFAVVSVFGACDNMADIAGPAEQSQIAPGSPSANKGSSKPRPAPLPTDSTAKKVIETLDSDSDFGLGWP